MRVIGAKRVGTRKKYFLKIFQARQVVRDPPYTFS